MWPISDAPDRVRSGENCFQPLGLNEWTPITSKGVGFDVRASLMRWNSGPLSLLANAPGSRPVATRAPRKGFTLPLLVGNAKIMLGLRRHRDAQAKGGAQPASTDRDEGNSIGFLYAYALALEADPTWLAAQARQRADAQARSIARDLRPNLSYSSASRRQGPVFLDHAQIRLLFPGSGPPRYAQSRAATAADSGREAGGGRGDRSDRILSRAIMACSCLTFFCKATISCIVIGHRAKTRGYRLCSFWITSSTAQGLDRLEAAQRRADVSWRPRAVASGDSIRQNDTILGSWRGNNSVKMRSLLGASIHLKLEDRTFRANRIRIAILLGDWRSAPRQLAVLKREARSKEDVDGIRTAAPCRIVRKQSGGPPMPFDLRQLRYALAAAKLGSHHHAARACDVEEDLIAENIATLERQLRRKLFEPAGAGILPTPDGLRFFREAEHLLWRADQISSLLAAMPGEAGALDCPFIDLEAADTSPTRSDQTMSIAFVDDINEKPPFATDFLNAVPLRAPEEKPSKYADLCRSILAARKLIGRAFGADLFADPAGEMLFDLYVREDDGIVTSITSIWNASNAAYGTARRSLSIMESRGLITRAPDVHDGRRTLVFLTDSARRQIEACLDVILGP